MWISFGKSIVTLDTGHTLALKHARGMEINCLAGNIWLSIEGDARDILLHPGHSYTLTTGGLAVMEGLPHATIRLERQASWPQSLASRLSHAVQALWPIRLPTLGPVKTPHASVGSP
ncbi:DUF2917 domain-containing protein [Uliginosibacterium gangwonense]|uniref:DUF2917 domain-containing protein n=1 Tax=Uliginosibacterium gangwonense TaxID=392736 RepID=UPI000372060C|nr:DUF2917 domain-containing protein [Uliginosibacterium gangwonense]